MMKENCIENEIEMIAIFRVLYKRKFVILIGMLLIFTVLFTLFKANEKYEIGYSFEKPMVIDTRIFDELGLFVLQRPLIIANNFESFVYDRDTIVEFIEGYNKEKSKINIQINEIRRRSLNKNVVSVICNTKNIKSDFDKLKNLYMETIRNDLKVIKKMKKTKSKLISFYKKKYEKIKLNILNLDKNLNYIEKIINKSSNKKIEKKLRLIETKSKISSNIIEMELEKKQIIKTIFLLKNNKIEPLKIILKPYYKIKINIYKKIIIILLISLFFMSTVVLFVEMLIKKNDLV